MDVGINYRPKESEREVVKALVGFGESQRSIAKYLDMSTDTLKKYFERELAIGKLALKKTCAMRLYECVTDPNAQDKDRNRSAEWLLARCCGLFEKTQADVSIDSFTTSIRQDVDNLRDKLLKKRGKDEVNKDVDDIGQSTD